MVHLNDFQGLINQLSATKMTLDDELQALLLLSSLPESWDTLVVSLSNSAPEGKLTMEGVTSALQNEEIRRKEMGLSSQVAANVVQDSSRGRNRNRDSSQNRDKSRGRSKSKFRGKIIYHYCNKLGYIKKFCRKKKRDKSQERQEKNDNSRHQTEETGTIALATSDDLFFIGDQGSLNLASDECTWVIDSGASYHVTSLREYFSSYTSGDFGHVMMANDGSSKIIGMGSVTLETSTGCKLVLRDVRHVPNIRLNLISTGVLDEEGFTSQSGGGKWKLVKGNLVVARAKK